MKSRDRTTIAVVGCYRKTCRKCLFCCFKPWPMEREAESLESSIGRRFGFKLKVSWWLMDRKSPGLALGSTPAENMILGS